MIYGEPGTGKTTASATAPNAIMADAEKGSHFLGSQGLDIDIASITSWSEMSEFYKEAQDYDTVVLDPVGELMDKIIQQCIDEGLKSKSGTLTLQGWGVAKMKMKKMLTSFRDLDANLIIVAHSEETKTDKGLVKRPKIQSKLVDDMEAMMDVIGYLQVIETEEKQERRLYVQPTEEYHAKDRTGCLPEYIKPTWQDLIKHIEKKKESGNGTAKNKKKSGKK